LTEVGTDCLDAFDTDLGIFAAFFTEFSGRARAFDLNDAYDTGLWPFPLPFNQLMVFVTPVHAQAALRLYPQHFAPLPAPYTSPAPAPPVAPQSSLVYALYLIFLFSFL
jgi:hypothetical protein